ncbi:putative FMN-dependent luciferase-like monooxygenase [Acidovorax sp. sif1233]|uniref:putative FMN-dependent luciferase-like monooxygenase n=1 Tax=Acidovorax sp. sif1233 TaxID=2854792 RepID=UPI0021045693|nr:putative FMN-dependent luciferase-like monooxygenase [Acidovorax sp. sif1233]
MTLSLTSPTKRLGFFSRLLDDAPAGERYRLVTEQIAHAEAFGFDSAWVAQHHFHEHEGGLPSPFVFLAHVAARTRRIRLGTGIVTLPMENAVRVAEDAIVLDLLSGGRLELGVGTGGTPESFAAFGITSDDRSAVYARHLALVREAWAGRPLPGGDRLYPAAEQLLGRIWQATFSVAGGERAGQAGDGLMLSRTQPRTAEAPGAALHDLQHPIIDAYLAALPGGATPRIVGSRSLFVADDRKEALRLADTGLRRAAARFAAAALQPGQAPRPGPDASLEALIAAYDVHVGTPDDVIASLQADTALARATDIVFQVHSVDPPHAHILRSIELTATRVAPALGWVRKHTGAATTTPITAAAATTTHTPTASSTCTEAIA